MNPEFISNVILTGCDFSERTMNAALDAAPAVLRALVDSHPLTRFLPGVLKNRLISMIMVVANRAAGIFRDAIATFRMLARSAGRPTELRNAADRLQEKVTGGARTLASSITPTALECTSPDSWRSKAAAQYATGITDQVGSAKEISEISSNLESTLRDMADSIESFYFDLNWAWVGAALAIAGFVIGLATAPTGVGPIAGVVIGALGVIQALISIALAFTNAAGRNSSNAESIASSPGLVWTKSAFAS